MYLGQDPSSWVQGSGFRMRMDELDVVGCSWVRVIFNLKMIFLTHKPYMQQKWSVGVG